MGEWRHTYATRLNSFRARVGAPAGLPDLLRDLAAVAGLRSVELNYPQHLTNANRPEIREVLHTMALSITALNLRFEGPEYRNGAFTSPERAVRDRAVATASAAVDEAAAFGADHVIIWLAEDGFDYPFQVDHARLWDLALDGFRRVASHDLAVRVSIEYKPWDPRRFSVIRSMGDALLATRVIGLPNLGVTLDVCHSLMSGEYPAAAASLAMAEGRLFGIHLNDGYGRDDDGLAFGSVNPTAAAELLLVLRDGGYAGTLYFDTFPIREDPATECATNIQTVEALEHALDRIDRARLDNARQLHDALAARCVIEEALFARSAGVD